MMNFKSYSDLLFRANEILPPHFYAGFNLAINRHFYEQNAANLQTLQEMWQVENAELTKTPIKYCFNEGTAINFKEVINSNGRGAEVLEWFEYGGEPYHFKVNFSANTDEPLPSTYFDDLEILINKYKNVRSVFDGLTIAGDVLPSLYIGAVPTPHVTMKIICKFEIAQEVEVDVNRAAMPYYANVEFEI